MNEEQSTNDVVLETLAEKIRQQDRLIVELQAELQRARRASVDTMLVQLRLHEAVLLYVGQDADGLAQQITENFGGDVARAVSNSLFVLDNAPVSDEVREAIRKATNHGMSRWCSQRQVELKNMKDETHAFADDGVVQPAARNVKFKTGRALVIFSYFLISFICGAGIGMMANSSGISDFIGSHFRIIFTSIMGVLVFCVFPFLCWGSRSVDNADVAPEVIRR